MTNRYFTSQTFAYRCGNRDRWQKIKFLIGDEPTQNTFNLFIDKLIDDTYKTKPSILGA